MTINEFRKSRRWSDDIGSEIGADLGEQIPGFVYAGNLSIEAPAGGAGPDVYRLPLENDFIVSSNLKMLESRLYVHAKRDGWL